MNQQLTIEECIEQIIKKMHDLNYTQGNIEAYQHSYNIFLKYCKERNYIYYSENIGLEYLKEIYNLEITDLADSQVDSHCYKWKLRHLRILGEYSRSQIFITRFSKFHDPVESDGYWNELYDKYMNYLQNECDYAASTIRHKELTLRATISILIQLDVHDINNISKSEINEIISKFIHEAPKSMTHRIGELKQFFTYCAINNISKQDLTLMIPDVTVAHHTHIPINWSTSELKQLLESIERENPIGKRDYAILLIACRLGLRASDITNLKLSDFNWETNEIHLIQKKTHNVIILPLLNDIGWAVIDYIKNGRPITTDTALFVRAIPPYDALSSSSSLERIFVTRMHKAGLKVPKDKKCGIHSLRHTLGSILLDKETPLPIISQVLGHQSIKSTEVYLKLNLKKLDECPINPDKVFDDEL